MKYTSSFFVLHMKAFAICIFQIGYEIELKNLFVESWLHKLMIVYIELPTSCIMPFSIVENFWKTLHRKYCKILYISYETYYAFHKNPCKIVYVMPFIKPIYMYVQAYVMDSGSECTIYAVFSWFISSAKAYV